MTVRLEVDGRAEGEPDPLIGESVLGFYRIQRQLGAGGMGTVYMAEDPAIGRICIKVLHHDLSRRPDIVARFFGECRAASTIGHPHIVKFIARGQLADGRVFLAMEYLEGASLDRYLASHGPLAVDHMLALLVQAGWALHAAHTHGIVHRDIKPENIFVSPWAHVIGRVTVLDFGVAKFEDARMVDGVKTRTGALVGTPLYMSPEQALGQTVDLRSDVYSLAMVAYQMLTGHLPETVPGTHAWRDPRELRPDVPEGVARCILWGLEFHPDGRPRSMREWLLALIREASGEAVVETYAAGFLREAAPDESTRRQVSTGGGAAAAAPSRPGAVTTTLGEASGQRATAAQPAGPRWVVAAALGVIVLAGVVLVTVTVARGPREGAERAAAPDAAAVAAAPTDAALVEPAPATDATPEVVAATAPTEPAAEVDAGVAAMPPPAVDAGTTPEARATRNTVRPREPVVTGTGSVHVVVTPWAEVWIDGRRVGESPVRIDDLPVGKHKVKIQNDTKSETVTVTVHPDTTTRLTRSW